MKYILAFGGFFAGVMLQLAAQTMSGADYFEAQPVSDRDVWFNLSDTGVSKPIRWGLDLAWLSEENVRRGIAFMGAERIDVIRSSFTPTAELIDGKLPAAELETVNKRLKIIKLLNPETRVVLNSDHPSVHSWYKGNAVHWAQLIDVTTRLHEEAGRVVEAVAPFNEPDYSYTGQGTITDFYNIAGELRNNSHFDNIRISGGNTLNCDEALPWYNTLKSRLDEGNTHQLAGSFDGYAKFFTTVRANGHYAANDELHNTMEAMVGVEYGMQTGIWWGTAEHSRSEFVKASDGRRLSYAEHRPNWTAASVYRAPDGKVLAFGGTSERQAAETTYRFVSQERDVFYNGHGPQREYTMRLPGGTGYQVGQTNAETVVDITWGDDIQPVIDGLYTVVNKNSKKVMEVAAGAVSAGTNVRQAINAKKKYQQWNVTPVDSRIGGDFSYHTFTANHCGLSLDVLNFSLDNNGNIIAWNDVKNTNQQWFLEYAGEGWFYIRNRHSAKCLEVINNSTADGGNIVQGEKDGGANQLWRFIPTTVSVDLKAPDAPADLTATPQAASVRLDWKACTENDLAGYDLFRAETAGGPYNTLARAVETSSFIDNTAVEGKSYYYAVRAVDKALNRSGYSNEVQASVSAEKELTAHFSFDGSTRDTTVQLNHAAAYGNIVYEEGKVGTAAVALNGSSFLQLPTCIANHREMTVALWVYCKDAINNNQHLFDFGNGADEYMYLTPRAASRKISFCIASGGTAHSLQASVLFSYRWVHLTVTMGEKEVCIYVDGELKAHTDEISLRPSEFKPFLNYIGRGRNNDLWFKGRIDDFRIYNHALSADEVADLAAGLTDGISPAEQIEENLFVYPLPADKVLHVSGFSGSRLPVVTLYDRTGRLVLSDTANLKVGADEVILNVSGLSDGVYIIKIDCGSKWITRKITVKHS